MFWRKTRRCRHEWVEVGPDHVENPQNIQGFTYIECKYCHKPKAI